MNENGAYKQQSILYTQWALSNLAQQKDLNIFVFRQTI